MSFGRFPYGRAARVAGGIVLFLVVACSGKSDSGDDSGGTSSSGGMSGSSSGGTSSGGTRTGGTTGAGGTSGAGVGGSSGGTGSDQTRCARVCQAIAGCPDGPIANCETACADGIATAEDYGCGAPYRVFMDCMLANDVCGDAADVCPSEYARVVECLSGGGLGECAPTGTAPPSADCVPVCQGAQACPDGEPVDCVTSCAESDANAAAMGCSMQYRRILGCASTCENLCAFSNGDCSLEAEDYFDCVIEYCTLNPESAPCN